MDSDGRFAYTPEEVVEFLVAIPYEAGHGFGPQTPTVKGYGGRVFLSSNLFTYKYPPPSPF